MKLASLCSLGEKKEKGNGVGKGEKEKLCKTRTVGPASLLTVTLGVIQIRHNCNGEQEQ